MICTMKQKMPIEVIFSYSYIYEHAYIGAIIIITIIIIVKSNRVPRYRSLLVASCHFQKQKTNNQKNSNELEKEFV